MNSEPKKIKDEVEKLSKTLAKQMKDEGLKGFVAQALKRFPTTYSEKENTKLLNADLYNNFAIFCNMANNKQKGQINNGLKLLVKYMAANPDCDIQGFRVGIIKKD